VKSNKDVSNLIKESAYKLEQKPSKDAWSRLEQRLDQQEQASKSRFSIRSIFSIAATVAGLLVVISVASFFLQKQNAPLADSSNMAKAAFVVEELEVEETERGFYEVVEFQKTYHDRLSNPIAEGPGKKLAVAKFVEASMEMEEQTEEVETPSSDSTHIEEVGD